METKYYALLFVVMLAIGLIIPIVTEGKPSGRGAKPCRDGIDNDGDGYTDYPSDPGCSNKNDNSELNPSIECDDGTDNDGDSAMDMNDNGCSSPTDNDETDCGDGVCEGGETLGNCPADCGYPDSCSDTDGGNFIFVFGTTSGYYNNNPYSNNDYCVDSSNVMEYYCSGDYEQSQQQNCGTDTYGDSYCIANLVYENFTDYSCASGECDSDESAIFQEDCDTYDSYSSNYCNSGDVYRDFYDYGCSSGYCTNSTEPELVESCSWGCTAGVCDDQPTTCEDSDGGIVLNVTGTVSGYDNGVPYNYTDYCVNSTTVMEYLCWQDECTNYPITCYYPYTICSDGKCI